MIPWARLLCLLGWVLLRFLSFAPWLGLVLHFLLSINPMRSLPIGGLPLSLVHSMRRVFITICLALLHLPFNCL